MNKAGRPALHVGCKIEDCPRRHAARGYCNMHYKRIIIAGEREEDLPPPPPVINTTERLEDCRWMAETGEGLTGAAARLGMHRNSLDRWLRQHDRDCLARLMRQDPKDHNRSADGMSVSELTGQRARRQRRRERETDAA